ncbi:hypothetical protein PLESTM_000828000 [Pleodorina starrii]|nr:hypothetical protein PLESTM_000828000 [Pleodorina starrii]
MWGTAAPAPQHTRRKPSFGMRTPVVAYRQAGAAGSYWMPTAVQQHFSRVMTQGSAVDAAARLHVLRQDVSLSRQSLVALQRSLPGRMRRLQQAERDLRAMQGA